MTVNLMGGGGGHRTPTKKMGNKKYDSAQYGTAVPILHSNSGFKQMMQQQTKGDSKFNCHQKYEVYMRCVTWSRDSHGLFDYESKNIAKKNIKTQTGGKILRV